MAHAITCEIQWVKRDVDPATTNWVGPAYFPECRANGTILQVNIATGNSIVPIDLVDGKTSVVCDFSMDAFIELKLPFVTVAITNKSGGILDVQTDWTKNEIHVNHIPDLQNSHEFLALTCIQ